MLNYANRIVEPSLYVVPILMVDVRCDAVLDDQCDDLHDDLNDGLSDDLNDDPSGDLNGDPNDVQHDDVDQCDVQCDDVDNEQLHNLQPINYLMD